MGIERNTSHVAAAIALLLCGAGAGAAQREPLVVTELPDSTLVPLSEIAPRSQEQMVDEAAARFSLAVAQALASDQSAVEQACRSRPATGTGAAATYDWRARCGYQRR